MKKAIEGGIMKVSVLIFSCSFLALSGVASGAEMNDADAVQSAVSGQTMEKDLLFSQKNGKEWVTDKNENPFSGSVVKTDDGGRKITFFYRNGLRNGVATSYYEDGKMELEITYRNGLKDGEEISFYENGSPKLKKTYKADKLNGAKISFYENGKPKRQDYYTDGVLNGETTYFDDEGNRIKIEHYKSGIKDGVEHIIDKDMLQEENNYVGGQKNGVTKIYNKEYQTDEINYVDGKKEGVAKHYNADGSWIELPYVNDLKNGEGVAYYPDKKIANKANYLNDKKNGLSEKYYKNGLRKVAETYKNDKLDGIKRQFNQKGDLETVSYFVEGMELAKIEIAQDDELKDIMVAAKKGQLGKYVSKKKLWYPVLWLGINFEDANILQVLEKNMKMYNATLDDTKQYAAASKTKYQDYNRRLFFGLTPLSYAVNLSLPSEILQKFATPEHIDEQNPRGGTALQEAIRLNNLEMVKYLLLKQADVKNSYKGAIVLQAVQDNARLAIIEELLKAGADANIKDANGKTPLVEAVRNNDAALVSLLLKYQADTNITLPDGKNLLFFAVANHDDEAIIDRLLTHADVNKKDAEGNILLIEALAQKKYDLVEKLLRNGVNVNLTDASGESAVTYVLSHETDDKIIQQIYSADIDVVNNVGNSGLPLWKLLIENKKWPLLKIVLNKMGGADKAAIDGVEPIQILLSLDENVAPELENLLLSYVSTQWLNENSEFIWKTIELKNLRLWKNLVKIGFNPQIKDKSGDSPALYLLKNHYDLAWLEEFEKLQPELNETDKGGTSPLLFAIEENNAEVVQNLLNYGVKISEEKQKSYLARLTGKQPDMTNLLLKNIKDISFVGPKSSNLMMAAVKNVNIALLEALFAKGADIHERDVDGNEALHYIAVAVQKNKVFSEDELLKNLEQIIFLLKNQGVDINVQNGNGETLLIQLAKQNSALYYPLSEILIKNGANIDIKDQYGKTAASYMLEFKNKSNKNK